MQRSIGTVRERKRRIVRERERDSERERERERWIARERGTVREEEKLERLMFTVKTNQFE